MSGERDVIGYSKTIDELFHKDIVDNWSKFVDRTAKKDQRNLYGLIYNVLDLLEYEILRKEGLKEKPPRMIGLEDSTLEMIELEDSTLKSWTNYSKYNPKTTFEELGVDRKRIPGLWSRKFEDTKEKDIWAGEQETIAEKLAYFPIYTNELEKTKTVGKLVSRIYKRIKPILQLT